LQERWNNLELCGKQATSSQLMNHEPEFYDWFISEESCVVRNHMIQSVRKNAKLGDPPEKFFTNASESINNVLKLKVDRKSQSLNQFVDHAQQLVTAYEKNIDRAFSQRGDWRLVSSVKFDNDVKCKKVLKEIKECLCSLSAFLENNACELTVTEQSSATSSSSVSVASAATSHSTVATRSGVVNQDPLISFDVLQKAGCKIHSDTLKGIWQKAISLVSDTTMIVKVPGGKGAT